MALRAFGGSDDISASADVIFLLRRMEALGPRIEIAFGKEDEVASSTLLPNPKKSPSFRTGFSLELLARFELATRFHEVLDFMEALGPRIEIAFGKEDEVASSTLLPNAKKSPSFRTGFSLELLARFELATSSLPRMRSTD